MREKLSERVKGKMGQWVRKIEMDRWENQS